MQGFSLSPFLPFLRFSFSFLAFSLSHSLYPQDSTSFFQPAKDLDKKRLSGVVISEAVFGAGSLAGLNELWYKDFPRSSFHFFNDNAEWLGMDKAGHVLTSYTIGRIGIGLMKWSGVKERRAVWCGGMLGTFYQGAVEVLDGFSAGWGFSLGDFAANAGGGLLATGQELCWKEQRLVLKYSYHNTVYPSYRPEVLGRSGAEKFFKDYNGQTYWLSANVSSFLREDSKFPRWLNLAVGYGADGMTGGEFNPPYTDAGGNQIAFERSREFYFSLDADLSRIRTRCNFLKSFFNTFGFIKVPAPAFMLKDRKMQFSALYF